MQNILAVIAHPDDLELMAGGSMIKWLSEGKTVHVLTFTDGSWVSPDGKENRSKNEALFEEETVAKFIGYTYENLMQQTLHLQFHDDCVLEVLKRIDKYNIDTLIFPFKNDVHHDHEIVSRIAIAASRRVPNLLMGQINYYLGDFFAPNTFVDITNTWENKIRALKMYKGQWERAGKDWYEFLDATSKYYGKIIGVERAEGFYTPKILI
jgi:N-acetylglucosamine malate deacetylase 1